MPALTPVKSTNWNTSVAPCCQAPPTVCPVHKQTSSVRDTQRRIRMLLRYQFFLDRSYILNVEKLQTFINPDKN